MSKRPHAAFIGGLEEAGGNGVRPHERVRQVEAVLDHGHKELLRALKLSRGFERQKLGRRQKAAKGSEGGSLDLASRLEAEVDALKVG